MRTVPLYLRTQDKKIVEVRMAMYGEHKTCVEFDYDDSCLSSIPIDTFMRYIPIDGFNLRGVFIDTEMVKLIRGWIFNILREDDKK